MCLYVTKNPLEGKVSVEFDEKGYATYWKVYRKFDSFVNCSSQKGLSSPYRGGVVKNGWIVSNRKNKKISCENDDTTDVSIYEDSYVNRGIHVFTSEEIAKSFAVTMKNSCDPTNYIVVPVRCHKTQLVAVGAVHSQAVFMKVFLKKEDYDEALKG